ncbi:MAG: hypothetical protein HRT88_19190 [Lentisphaeraceae bacterium]|nr:hypothetical protein [Lentisphaeraceae bacterium]
MFGPPQVDPPSREIYGVMGEENIEHMLEDFYLKLQESEIKGMFPQDMIAASRKSAAFFIGLCGGPPLYHQLYGHPRLRQRHMPFPIDENSKDVWLRCFEETLENSQEKYSFPYEHLEGFLNFIKGFSPWMMNS